MNCPRCGAGVVPGAQFCGGCGHRLNEPGADAPAPPAPRPGPTPGTAGASGGVSRPAPVGVPAEVVKQKEKMERSSKPK